MDKSVSSSSPVPAVYSTAERERSSLERMGEGRKFSHGGKSLSGFGEARLQVQPQLVMTYSRGTGAPVKRKRHKTPKGFVLCRFRRWQAGAWNCTMYREAKSGSEAIPNNQGTETDVHPTLYNGGLVLNGI